MGVEIQKRHFGGTLNMYCTPWFPRLSPPPPSVVTAAAAAAASNSSRRRVGARMQAASGPHNLHSLQRAAIPRHTHVVFIGDSLLRYEYIALALAYHFANAAVEQKSDISMLRHKPSTMTWSEYYSVTSGLLQPNEFCDCYRRDTNSTRPHERPLWIENRYYHDPHRDVTFTFVLWVGSHYSSALVAWWPGQNDSLRRPHADEPKLLRELRVDALGGFLQQLTPPITHIVVNEGHHLKLPLSANAYTALFASLWRGAPSSFLWWSTTTACPQAAAHGRVQHSAAQMQKWDAKTRELCATAANHTDVTCRWMLSGLANEYCKRSMQRWNASQEVTRATAAGFCVFDAHNLTLDVLDEDFMDGLHFSPRAVNVLLHKLIQTLFPHHNRTLRLPPSVKLNRSCTPVGNLAPISLAELESPVADEPLDNLSIA